MQRLATRLDVKATVADAAAAPVAQPDGMTPTVWPTTQALRKKPAALAAGVRHLKRRLKELAPCSARWGEGQWPIAHSP